VVGVPARWLFAVEKELPPADEDAARAALRLQAERLPIAESGEVACDFVGAPSSTAASRVLLVGMLRERLEKIEQIVDSAGMTLVAVTSTGLTLAAAFAQQRGGNGAAGDDADGPMLVLARSGAEMVVRHGGQPRLLRHVPFTMNGHGVPPVAPLGAELRRAVTLSPGDSGRDLLLVDAVGVPEQDVRELSGKLGIAVRSEDGLELLGIAPAAAAAVADPASEHPVEQFAVPLSLALAGARPELLPLDFHHSRLTPPAPRRINRVAAWSVAAALLVAVAVAGLYWSVGSRQAQLDEMNQRLVTLKPTLARAQTTVDRVTYGRGFFQTRPAILDCLREITLAFRDDERIWANNFQFKENGKGGVLSGRCSDPQTARDQDDRLRKNPHFADVRLPGVQEADPRTHEQSFTIAFDYKE
jgi:hypothetical protein